MCDSDADPPRHWRKRRQDCFDVMRVAMKHQWIIPFRERHYQNVTVSCVRATYVGVRGFDAIRERTFYSKLRCCVARNAPHAFINRDHNWIIRDDMDKLLQQAVKTELVDSPFLLVDMWKIVATYL